MLASGLYAEISIICLIVLVVVGVTLRSGLGSQGECRTFARLVIATLVVDLSDLVWLLAQSLGPERLLLLSNVSMVVYFAVQTLVGYFWLVFVILRLHMRASYSRTAWALLFLPTLAIVILCVLSMGTGWLFGFTDGVYHRGPLFALVFVVMAFYLSASVVYCIRAARHALNRWARKTDLTMAGFVVLPIVALILSAAFPGYPFSVPGITLSIVLVFLSLQNSQIYQDGLTGINNRRLIEEKLDEYLKGLGDEERLGVFMLDVDYFKQVNDVYGQLEGDHALRLVAEALTNACGKLPCIIGRFGGDEFEVVWMPESDEDPAQVSTAIDVELLLLLKRREVPYEIGMSMGYAECVGPTDTTADELIHEADLSLYERKRERHAEGEGQGGA